MIYSSVIFLLTLPILLLINGASNDLLLSFICNLVLKKIINIKD